MTEQLPVEESPKKGFFASKWTRILFFLSILGPGLITATVDNDSGGIATYSLAGAIYGYDLLWTLIPITVLLVVTMEMGARLGAVTGQGLADLLRERFGVKTAFYLLFTVFIANFGTVLSEFSGIASSIDIIGNALGFGPDFAKLKYILVPLLAWILWKVITEYDYKKIEKFFLLSILFYLAYPISAYLAKVGHLVANIGINEGAVTVSFYKMLQKNVPQSVFSDIGQLCARLRAVKSEYELNKMKKAGELSREIYALIPGLIKLGMSEWELGLLLFQESAKRGLNCMSRVAGGNEFFFGNISFGENSLYPSAFDGPGGIRGRSPACPFLGSDRTLKAGDLIYIDMVTPCDEYYIDKTRVYSAGKPSQKAIDSFQKCCAIQDVVRDMLKPNVTPSYIYNKIYKEYIESDPEFAEHFMGYRQNQVKFLGHGIGIVLDEYPVIADKFNLPLEASMTIAVEPKKGIEGIGMVGIEDTFIVSPNGGINITEDFREIIVL